MLAGRVSVNGEVVRELGVRVVEGRDIVEVDDTYGQVEHIGARSTRVKTFDNIHIIVPNSAVLKK